MIYVKRITSTIQGGIDAELSSKTVIYGLNASKKSAITRAVELALTGTASDIAGRDEVARTIDLLSLAPPDQNLTAVALLSDGTQAKYELLRVTSKKGSKVTSSAQPPLRPRSIDPERVLPLRTLRDAVLGTPERSRKFFLAHSTRPITRADILARIPESLHGHYMQAVQGSQILTDRPELDKLLAALEWADKRSGDKGREAKASQQASVALGQGLAPPPTEIDYAEAKTQLAAARRALEEAVASYQIQSQRADVTEKLRALHAQLEEAKVTLARWKEHLTHVETEAQKLEPIPPEPQGLTDGQLAVVKSILWHAEQNHPICYCCRTNVPPTEWAGRAKIARQELDAAESRIVTLLTRRRELIEMHRRKDEVLAGAQFEVTHWTEIVQARANALHEVHGVVPGPENGAPVGQPLTIENARLAVQTAEARLSNMASAEAAWESAKKARDASANAESEEARLGQLAKACTGVVRELLDYGVQSFAEKVQAFLPRTDRFGLRLRDGGRDVCQFGLYHGDALHTALSGAEWARVTAALAAVCGPTADDQLAVIRPEERAFDPGTLSEVLSALVRAPQQILFETPIRPAVVPQGWTLIELVSPAQMAPKQTIGLPAGVSDALLR